VDPAETASSSEPELVRLDAAEARILGCLIEKAAITPEVYPLTINAIVAASNQKTSRDPVMNLEIGAVTHTLRGMEARGLVKVAPSSQRAVRYEHRFDAVYGVTARQRAILCALLLRGAQTLAELHTRTERLADFPSIDDVRDALDRLIQREPPLVVRVPHGPGQRENRYMHLLSGPVDISAFAGAARFSAPRASDRDAPAESTRELEARVAQLEAEVAALKQAVVALESRLGSDAQA
jgi:uncharacterized protein YceH (UPF0502 family)